MPVSNAQNLPKTGKIIALDVGEKTVGVAMSDGLRMIAQPLTTLRYDKFANVRDALHELCTKEQASCFVIGLPLHMNGDMSPSADRAQSFAHQIEADLGLPVLLWDERMTTVAAENALFEHRQGRQKRASKKDVKQQVDNVAAALILQGVLDLLRY